MGFKQKELNLKSWHFYTLNRKARLKRLENLKLRKQSKAEKACFQVKEKDAEILLVAVENANAVEFNEHLNFYHILPFHKRRLQA